MKIKLDDKHYLVSDSFCCWIGCEYKTKKGNTALKHVSGYCNTFGECVEDYIQTQIKSSTAETVTELKVFIDKLVDKVAGWII